NGLPYIKLTDSGLAEGQLITTSTLDGHRFASEYIMSSLGVIGASNSSFFMESFRPGAESVVIDTTTKKKDSKKESKKGGKKAGGAKPEFAAFVRQYLGMSSPDRCPAANVPNIFALAA